MAIPPCCFQFLLNNRPDVDFGFQPIKQRAEAKVLAANADYSFTLTGDFCCISTARSRWLGMGWNASTNSIVTSICSAATCLLSSLLSHLETISATPASRRIRGKSFAIWARRSSTEAVPKPCWFRVACHSLPSVAAGRVRVLVHGERPGQ